MIFAGVFGILLCVAAVFATVRLGRGWRFVLWSMAPGAAACGAYSFWIMARLGHGPDSELGLVMAVLGSLVMFPIIQLTIAAASALILRGKRRGNEQSACGRSQQDR